jgi:hypothetical protein
MARSLRDGLLDLSEGQPEPARPPDEDKQSEHIGRSRRRYGWVVARGRETRRVLRALRPSPLRAATSPISSPFCSMRRG